MSEPIMPLDKNGTLFTEKAASMEEALMVDEEEVFKKKIRERKQEMDKGNNITGDLLDGVISMLSALRRGF